MAVHAHRHGATTRAAAKHGRLLMGWSSRVLAVRRARIRGGGVWKHLVVDLIVGVDVVADRRDGGEARSGRDGGERDVDDVVAQPAAVWPPARRARRRGVATEHAEAVEAGLTG